MIKIYIVDKSNIKPCNNDLIYYVLTEKNSRKMREKAIKIYKQILSADLSKSIHIYNQIKENHLYSIFVESFLLFNYKFDKYKSKKSPRFKISYQNPKLVNMSMIEGVCIARDLVNEPLSFLTAQQLTKEIKKYSKNSFFKLETLNEKKIRDLAMGGVLSVNKGSVNPSNFNILTYKAVKHKSSKPIVLVGKGVMYDTGGLSLKPTANSMDMMKSDMAGAAAVVGAIYAIAKMKLNVHVVGLIPAVENRPGGNAYVPGDVITMMNGSTVEVLNTDAEGRMILADALHYAKRLNPSLVIDLATLTGSAARAVGKYGIPAMGNASHKIIKLLEESGAQIDERIAMQPFWDEYRLELESDIADLKNIGSAEAGHITAGKFLEYFTKEKGKSVYPWIHLDIAGVAFLQNPHFINPKGGTGVGVRLLCQFIKNYSSNV
tara:strand:- start:1435 stop:2733 length:1299 start_codon:yes stop_codon:yes gene_type:complete